MLTPAEIAAMSGALGAADAEVRRLEKAAADSSTWPGWLFPTQEQLAARTARTVLDTSRHIASAAVEDGDHETAMHVVQMARELATPGWTAESLERLTVGDAAADAAKAGLWALIPWWVWAVLALVVLVWVTPTLALFRRRS